MAVDRTGNYQAWMSKVTFGSSTSVEPLVKDHTPLKFALEQNYPNPFKHTTTIDYSIPKAGHVSLQGYEHESQ